MDTTEDEIRDAVRGWFVPKKRYTLGEVKQAIQQFYDHFGKTDEKASASDLQKYMPGEYDETMITIDGKRYKGYRIL